MTDFLQETALATYCNVFFIVLLMDFSHQRTEVTIKIRKKAGIPDQTVDE